MRWGLLAVLICLGCSTAVQDLKTDVIYRRDMELTINQVRYIGTATVPRAGAYEIIAISPNDMDFFIFRSCHREITTENTGNKKKYVYVPQARVESSGACPAEIIGLNKKGKHSFAYLAFEDPEKTLPAVLTCNGQVIQSNGTSLCQAASSLVQEISFDSDVLMSDVGNDNPACMMAMKKQGKSFEFRIPSGKCFYTFAETSEPHRRHRMFTLGYGEIILREN